MPHARGHSIHRITHSVDMCTSIELNAIFSPQRFGQSTWRRSQTRRSWRRRSRERSSSPQPSHLHVMMRLRHTRCSWSTREPASMSIPHESGHLMTRFGHSRRRCVRCKSACRSSESRGGGVCVSARVCVCVCDREKETEREREGGRGCAVTQRVNEPPLRFRSSNRRSASGGHTAAPDVAAALPRRPFARTC